jgi:hypothetical protein
VSLTGIEAVVGRAIAQLPLDQAGRQEVMADFRKLLEGVVKDERLVNRETPAAALGSPNVPELTQQLRESAAAHNINAASFDLRETLRTAGLDAVQLGSSERFMAAMVRLMGDLDADRSRERDGIK